MTAPAYRFGPYTVDPSLGQIRKFDIKIKLAGHPFLILILLLERPGQLITREEIRERLWGTETFVDFENSLNKAVAKLRQAICDSAEEPIYVETIPRRGYRFIGALDEMERNVPTQVVPGNAQELPGDSEPQTAGAQAAEPAQPPEQQSQRPGWKTITTIAVALILLCGGLAWQYWSASSSPLVSSVAVLPVQYLSGDQTEEYLADGITDEMTTQLAKLGTFRVTSRTSSMQFKKSQKTLREIARALGVDALLEGSLERSGNRIRIHSQLIRAATDEHLWAETYDGNINELMDLEDRAARDVATKISRRLTPAQSTTLSRPRPVDPEAHIAYLQGRYFWNQRTGAGFQRALVFFQSAIKKDPNYAAAYAGLADTYLLLGGYSFFPQNEMIPKARDAARKSLELEDSAEAHTSLGLIAGNYDWDWAAAEKEYRRAIELNPNYPTAHHWYGNAVLTLTGRFDEALFEMRRAAELDPLSPIIATDRGVTLFMARRNKTAIEDFQKTLDLYPGYEEAQRWLASAYEVDKDYDKALAILNAGNSSHESPYKMANRAHVYIGAGRRAEASTILTQLENESKKHFVDPGIIAYIYMGMGRNEEAMNGFEKCVAIHSTVLTSLKVNPHYDPLRFNPRFQKLLHTVHLDN